MQGAMARDAAREQELCADHQGVSLHAVVRYEAHERQRPEQLCRTITRPALANERVQIDSAGQVVLKLKTAWRDGTTHIVMSPLEFMQRLAARANEGRLSCARAVTAAAPDPFGIRVTSLREVSGPPLHEPWGAGTECQVEGTGGTRRAGPLGRRVGGRRHGARLRTRPASAHQLGPAAQARFSYDIT